MNPVVGVPHFKSIRNQYRHANYTLMKGIKEFLDFPIMNAKKIQITTTVEDYQLTELKVSDNFLQGFKNLLENNEKNPLNMGHIRDGHEIDNENSEFGVGMKAAALNIGDRFYIYTRVGNKYYLITMDFQKMAAETDPTKSFQPEFAEISRMQYAEHHPYTHGSTLRVCKILPTICPATSQEGITEEIRAMVADYYSEYIVDDSLQVSVNGDRICSAVSYFDNPKCRPFNRRTKFYIMVGQGGTQEYIIECINMAGNRRTYKKYDSKERKFRAIKTEEYETYKRTHDAQYSFDQDEKAAILLTSTFAYFALAGIEDLGEKLPNDRTEIIKNKRKYAEIYLKKHNNGSHNYTIHRINLNSKTIGKILGITFNKDFHLNDGANDLVNAVRCIIDEHRSEYTADTTTAKFKNLKAYAMEKQVIEEPAPVEESESESESEEEIESESANEEVQENVTEETAIDETVNDEVDQAYAVEQPDVNPTVVDRENTTAQTITVTEGLKLIESWFRSNQHRDEFIDLLNKLLIDYTDRIGRSQINIFIQHMNLIAKYNTIVGLIHLKYGSSAGPMEMLGGSTIYTKHAECFNQ